MLTSANNFQTENLFSIESEKELIQSFRPIDQKKLLFPAELQFPLRISSYFTWKESSGVYTYLVFKKPNWDLPRGIVLKRAYQGVDAPTGRLCCWCNSYGSSEDIGMLSVAASATVSAGYILCKDLRCIEKIEEASTLAGKHPEDSIHKLYHRIGVFFELISQYQPE
ncbi:MAG: FBP domain-containing protein [Bdellovibrio sp.]|nr:FBP domain-containing protein [Bdellovibrio sp.]